METPHVFGQYDHLFGIHTESESAGAGGFAGEKSDIAVLMLTAGMLSHVGPSRLHVCLAESLSQQGIGSFRFDLSGIGESLPIGGQGASVMRAVAEVKQAMDFLQREYNYQGFILFGPCSGADDALAVALQDDRVLGASLMDGCGYPTPKHKIHLATKKYLPKLFSPAKWLEMIRKRTQGKTAVANSMPVGADIREFPEREQAELEIRSLVDRGVRFQFIYTGGVIDYYSYEHQFYDMFPSLLGRNEITVQYQPRWDHLAFLEEDRVALLATLQRWMVDTSLKVRESLVGA